MNILKKAINKSKGLEDFMFYKDICYQITDEINNSKENLLNEMINNSSDKDEMVLQIFKFNELTNLLEKINNITFNDSYGLIYLNEKESYIILKVLKNRKTDITNKIKTLKDEDDISDACELISLLNITIKDVELTMPDDCIGEI